MLTRYAMAVLCFGLMAWGVRAEDIPSMKFNETRQIAPGVFFRYSSISATDKSIPFGGSNHVWIVFKDFVVVIDANFPKEAGDVLKDIRKTTDKPIRFVLDTHHHGDHAYGNAIWAKEGATIVGQTNCFRLMTTVGPDQYKQAGKERADVAATPFQAPMLAFDDKLVIDDGAHRVEFLFLGHAHTAGDACAYLPKQKILCTGDACVNGAFNYMGHSDSASWIRVLDKMEQLDVKLVCPGHGPMADRTLFPKQRRYFQELRQQVQDGINSKQSFDEIAKGINMPWYKEWTGKDAKEIAENTKHVYDELTGKINPSTLGMLNFPESDRYWRGTQDWTQPRRILVPNLSPIRLAELHAIAPNVEFVTARTTDEAKRKAAAVDAIVGMAIEDGWTLGGKVRWVHLPETANLDLKGLVITALPADRDPEQAWSLCLENVRRFAAGEKLLGPVGR